MLFQFGKLVKSTLSQIALILRFDEIVRDNGIEFMKKPPFVKLVNIHFPPTCFNLSRISDLRIFEIVSFETGKLFFPPGSNSYQ